jgi:hypothetical protein
MSKFRLLADISKVDAEQQVVFGWFSVVEENGAPVVDSQGDVIAPAELEKAAYDFVLDARVAGEMHKRIGVGRLVESMVFTKEKQDLLGIDLGKIGWWGGFKIDDPEVWDAVKIGKYRAFSIGGRAKQEEI